ncbi:UNVERIFIED_CONTAM: hypothetical protein GTU68_062212, partial [Idotea baltica]|nr:hypothetical protein [Idotea baltica]
VKFNLYITGGVYSSQSSYSALQFCRATIEQGHTITQVFFYQDGVSQGNGFTVPMSDEFDAVTEWQRLNQEHQIALVVCVSAAERRGVLGDEQALENSKTGYNLHSCFKIAGLGELHAASLASDRTVSFK